MSDICLRFLHFATFDHDFVYLNGCVPIPRHTVCEHMTVDQYQQWLEILPSNKRIVLQSNDFFECEEHINCQKSLKEFEKNCGLTIEESVELTTDKYKRFMIIGFKK